MSVRRAVLLALLAAACAEEDGESASRQPARGPEADPGRPKEPDKVAFDHIMIAFKGSKNSRSSRTRDAARRLAEQVYDAAEAGGTWQTIKDEYSDDRSARGVALGPYVLTNFHVPHVMPEIPRSKYSQDLADRLFGMKVGEIALVRYHRTRCPFGNHVLLRLQ